MERIARTADVVVFLRAHARDIEALILETRDRLRLSNERTWQSQRRLDAMQECLDQANIFLAVSGK